MAQCLGAVVRRVLFATFRMPWSEKLFEVPAVPQFNNTHVPELLLNM